MENLSGAAKDARRKMLADHVYDELLAALVDGSFGADSTLNIDALARTMDVSQTPIREALARLEATGLVRRVALKGYRVSPVLSAAEFDQLMDARLALEPVNSYLACLNVTPELMLALDDSVKQLTKAKRGPSFAEFRTFLEADEQFHGLIAEAAGNRFLMSAYNALGGQLQRFRLFAGLGVTDADHAILEHERIRDAFAAGDAELARAMMTAHITDVKSRAARDVGVRK
jgi:DNA-binding GntR family transcriptional regulator